MKRQIFAVRDLLDLAILDSDGRPIGRVDDVEIANDGLVTALLVGGYAFSDRFKGSFRKWFRALYRRFHDEKEAGTVRIAWSKVHHINSRVDLNVTIDDTGLGRMERWAVERVIGHIPGADHAPS